jgi:hypothetical protein
MLSVDTPNTRPATLWRRDPLRSTIAAPPLTMPIIPARMWKIFEEYPDPPDLPPRDYDVHDRREARRAVRRRLRPAPR